MVVKIAICALVFLLFLFFYKKASGSLSLGKLNMISFSFYLLLVTSLVGSMAIFLGFRNHYTILELSEENACKGFYFVAYTLVTLPLFICIFNRLLGIRKYGLFFQRYTEKPVRLSAKGQKTIFGISLLMTAICFLSVVYTLYHVGYIALLELLKGKFYLLEDRVSITREFTGNNYIRNIFAIGFTPMFSYFAYINYHYTKTNKWKWLFVILFILSIVIKTYNFEKAPVVIYLFYFYIIQVLIGNSGQLRKFIKYIGVAAGLIVIMYYFVLGYSGKLLSLSSGPISRLLITQISGLFKHVEIFPAEHPFLNGASFPKIVATLLGTNGYGERSGRVVMTILYPENVADNLAGVMNSLFSAEAYANYGIIGIIIAPMIVAFCMSVIPNFILKQRKTPLNITLYILFCYTYISALIGGFVDFIYSASLILLFMIFMVFKFFENGGVLYFSRTGRR